MTVTEWLYRAWNLKTEIAQLREELRAEEEKITRIVAATDKPMVSSTKDPHRYDALADLSRQIENNIYKRLRMLTDIQDAIETVEDVRCRMLLRKRFIECKDWKRISAEMGYSDRQMKRLYGKAVKEITPAVEKKMSL